MRSQKHRRRFRARGGVAPAAALRRDGFCGASYRQAARRLALDEELRPGLNCCAVCATRAGFLRTCEDCGRVAYCSSRCAALDRRHHVVVCPVLAGLPEESLEALSVEEAIGPIDARPVEDGDLPESAAELARFRSPADALALSFPLSAARALAEFPRLARALRGGGAIDVVGAAAPECAAPASWWACALDGFAEAGAGIIVRFVGPDVPDKAPDSCDNVILCYERGAYEASDRSPSLVVGFNLGLTDDGYSWDAALAAAPESCPFVFFAPSALERSRERSFLAKRLFECEFEAAANEFAAPNWKQSGMCANDVYRKHRYSLAGRL